MKSDETFKIGSFEFSQKSLILKDISGNPVALRSQSAAVLALLVEHRGEIVEKDAIMDNVWRDSFVTDDSLVQCISDIRRALQDTDHSLVQTFSKKGYRLNIPAPSASEPVNAKPGPSRPDRKTAAAAGIAIALAAAMLFAYFNTPQNRVVRDTVPTIAVLPFDDFSAGKDKGYLSDAIAEGIITELARNKIFTVTSRNSSFIYRSSDKGIDQITDELGVEYILEGSQQKHDDALRVTVQLIDGATSEHIWANVYEQEIGDLFIVQDKIIRTVADRVGTRIEERPLPLPDPDKVTALNLVMQAIQEIRKNRSASGSARMRELAEQAIQIDPDFASGHITLAWSYRGDAVFGWNGMERDKALELAEKHAEIALDLAPDDAEAHYIRARLHVERNEIEKAIIRFDRAIELNPSDSNIMNASSSPLLYIGRTDDGIARIEQAMGIDPFHPDHFHWQMSWALWQKGDCVASEAAMRKMDKISHGAQRMLAAALACQRKIKEARAALAIFTEGSNQVTLSGERKRLQEIWTAPGALDRWINDLRLAGLAE